jgi:alpha-2-macroglobulin
MFPLSVILVFIYTVVMEGGNSVENEIAGESESDLNQTASSDQASLVDMDSSSNESKYEMFKNYFKQTLTKIRFKWNSLPKKTRVVIGFVLVFSVLTAGLVLRLIVNQTLKIPGRLPTSIADFGDWKKLDIPQRQSPFFVLSSTTQGKYGILPNESLVLKTEKDIDINFLRANIDSSIPLTISRVSSQEFVLSPQRNLGLEEALSIKLVVKDEEISGYTFDRDYSWAYQSQGKFRITETIPGDSKTNVPLNAGIEIVFSQDGYNDPTPLISVSPSFKFRTEVHAERFVIVPLEDLEEKTLYTVTLRRGLNLKSRNDPISQDYSITFQTMAKRNTSSLPFFSLSEDFQQVSPTENFVTKVHTNNWNPDLNISAEVYRFPTPQLFVDSRKDIDRIQSSWETYYAENQAVGTSGLEKVMTVKLKVQNKDDTNYLQLPDRLPQGYYIVQFWFGDKEKLEQLWLQSTNLTGFVSVGKEHTVVWANTFNGGPVRNASISVVGLNTEYKTNDNGLSTFGTPSLLFQNTKRYLEISDEELNKLFLPVNSLGNNSGPGEVTKNDYWSYIYNERYLYKPGDTVYFFGVIKSRINGQPPANAEVILRNSGFPDENLLTRSVTPSFDGSFIGSFDLDEVPMGWYSMILKVNEVELESSNFSVSVYDKPEMKIEVISDKKAIFANEKVNFSARLSFMDETPVSNVPVKIYSSRGGFSADMHSGDIGELNYTYQTTYNDSDYPHYPRYESVTFNPAIAQEAKAEGFGSVYVFGSKLMIKSESEQDGHAAKFRAFVNNVDLSKINSGESSDFSGKASVNTEVNMKLIKTWYERKEIGVYYDFIEKVTRKSYSYTKHEEEADRKVLKTNDRGEINYNFTMEEMRSYSVEMEVKDNDGRTAKTSQYYYYGWDQNANFDMSNRPQLNIDKDQNIFSLNEEVDVNILLGDKEYPDNDTNRFLFLVANRGYQEVILNESPRYSFPFATKHMPNVYVGAYVYTGSYYVPVSAPCQRSWFCYDYYYYGDSNFFSGLLVSYKKEDSELTLTIDSEKSRYQPGDSAVLTVRTERNGERVSATVNLVLVDEALAALDGVRKPNILPSLYETVQSFVYYNYNSHKPVLPDSPQAEMGGGGGGDRDVFKDAAFFGRLSTDENGEAKFTVELPDNITSWRVYAQAITENMVAGQVEGRVIVSKDFFVSSQFPRNFLQKDKPVLTGGSYGVGLNKDTKVDYTALFFRDNTEFSRSQKTTDSQRSINFTFPDLKEGEYTALLRGNAVNLEDGIRLPFKVVSSRLNFEYASKFELEKGETLNSFQTAGIAGDKPLRLVISDRGKGVYYRSLAGFCYIESNRIEKQIAKMSSSKLLRERFEDDSCSIDEGEVASFQNYDGGVGQVRWGSSNLATTAWALKADAAPFDKVKLTDYLEKSLEQAGGVNLQKIYASWGLTLLGKPKVNELQSLSQLVLTYEEKVILGLALADAGDIERARDIYYDLLAEYAYTYQPYIRIQAELKGKDKTDSYIENTASALLLGSLVERNYNERMHNYIRDFKFKTQDAVIDLASIAFIGEQLDKLPDENTRITFVTDRHNVNKTLDKGRSYSLRLTANEINNFTLRVIEGKAEAYFNYYLTPDGMSDLATDDLLSIKRSYKKTGGGSKYKAGELVEIRIDFGIDQYKSPTGCYTITDHLPSGLKYIPNPPAYGMNAEGYMFETENNVVTGTFCNTEWWQKHGKKYMIYFARASSVGEYVAEPAIIQSESYPSNFQNTSEHIVLIEGSNQ